MYICRKEQNTDRDRISALEVNWKMSTITLGMIPAFLLALSEVEFMQLLADPEGPYMVKVCGSVKMISGFRDRVQSSISY